MINVHETEIKYIKDFHGARSSLSPSERLKEVRKRAVKFHEKMLDAPAVIYYRSFGLIRVPYPTKYGLRDAFSLPVPLMHILNRLFIIQYRTTDGIKTLLFSPSDVDGNRKTPYFKRMGDEMGMFRGLGEKFLAPQISTVEDALATSGIHPDKVDYISYDHLHTQDLRKWFGRKDHKGYFPNAKLLVMKEEWEIARGLLPIQADWYCPNGTAGIPEEKVILMDSDVMPGDGIALIRTPGHTSGNHSLVAHTPYGILVTSENGVCSDSYAPLHSSIPGVRQFAEKTGYEVILNGNTLEGSTDQYISMIQEKEIAGPNRKNSDFANFVPSSEMSEYWGFPGLKPTFSFGDLNFGFPVKS